MWTLHSIIPLTRRQCGCDMLTNPRPTRLSAEILLPPSVRRWPTWCHCQKRFFSSAQIMHTFSFSTADPKQYCGGTEPVRDGLLERRVYCCGCGLRGSGVTYCMACVGGAIGGPKYLPEIPLWHHQVLSLGTPVICMIMSSRSVLHKTHKQQWSRCSLIYLTNSKFT